MIGSSCSYSYSRSRIIAEFSKSLYVCTYIGCIRAGMNKILVRLETLIKVYTRDLRILSRAHIIAASKARVLSIIYPEYFSIDIARAPKANALFSVLAACARSAAHAIIEN